MPKPKVRHYPTKGFLVSSMGDVRFVRDEKHRDPQAPEAEDSCLDGCSLIEDMGHCVHFLQVKRAIRQPLYKMKIVSTGPNYFIAVLNRKRIKFYTHRAPQMQALLGFYGPRLVGWLHDLSLFECQGYFFSVTTDPEDFLECMTTKNGMPKRKHLQSKRVSEKEWVHAHLQPAVLRAVGDLQEFRNLVKETSTINNESESK